MRRAIVLFVIVAVGAGSALNASAKVRQPETQCRYRGGGGWSDRDVKQAIACAVGKWSVPGGVRKARSVARCESGYAEGERNSTSSAAGVYQFLSGTWAAVKNHYREVMRRYSLSESVVNARANVMLAIRYAHAGGWSPWTCA